MQIGTGDIGSPFTGYTTTCGTQTQNGTSMPATVTGLQNGVAVNCTVVVHNTIGSSPASDPVAATPKAGTGTSIAAHTPDPSRVNTPYTVSVAVLGDGTPRPGGQVTVSDGAGLCVATLTSGTPSTGNCTLVSTSRGNRTLTASYGGDAANMSSSGTAAHTVADLPGAPALTAAQPGDGKVTLVFDAPASDGGSAILDYTGTCGMQSATGTVSPLTVTGLTNDVEVSCHVTARNAASTGTASNALTATPAPARVRATLALTEGTEPGTWGQSVAFTATLEPVAPANTTPTGTVTFKDGAATITGCASLALTTTTPITATCRTTALSVGDHAITAQYGGDAHYAAGQQPASNTVSHTIGRVVGSVDFGTLNFVYDGSVRTITAQLHDESGTSCTVVPATVGPNAGSTTVTASCNGTNHTASGSAAAVIAKAATTLTLSSSCMRTFVEGQPYTLVATLSGGANPSGNVGFTEGQAMLCSTVAVNNGTAGCVATLSAHQQPVALLSLGAGYGGDGNHVSSQAAVFDVTALGLAEAIFRYGFQSPGDPDVCPIE